MVTKVFLSQEGDFQSPFQQNGLPWPEFKLAEFPDRGHEQLRALGLEKISQNFLEPPLTVAEAEAKVCPTQ
jgi:hypothetical protein